MLVCNSAKWLKNKLIFQNGYITQQAVISYDLSEMISPVQFNHLIIIKMNFVQNKTSFEKKQWVSGCILNNFFLLSSNMQIHHSLVCILLINILNLNFWVLMALSIFRTGLCEKYIWGPLLVFHLSLESGSA